MIAMARALVVAGLLASAVAGCKRDAPAGDAAAPDAPPAADAAASPTPAGSVAPPQAAAPPATTPPATTPTAAPVLAVDGEGLRLVDPASGATRALPFGTPEADTEAVLAAALGRAPDERGETSECGSRRFARWNGAISAWFGDEGFSGWSLPEGSGLSTMAGVRLGSSRKALASAYAAEVMASSLGTEFVAGAMGGVLASDAPDAAVTHLWAGDTCIAR
jgi:hypothetical protein